MPSLQEQSEISRQSTSLNSTQNADLPSLRGSQSEPRQSTSLNFAKNFTENSQVVDCFEFADANSRNDGINDTLASYKKLNFHTLSEDERREGYIFHILSDFVSENSREKLANLAKKLSEIYPCEIQIHICEDTIFRAFADRDNYLTYFRIFIPNIMPKNLNYVLYLDVDMLVLQDLRQLWSLDLSGKIAAVVKDWSSCAFAPRHAKSPRDRDFQFPAFYFNAGFMLINLPEFVEHKAQEKCLYFLSNFEPHFADQDALNFAIPQEFALTLPLNFDTFITAYHDYMREIDYTAEQIAHALDAPIIVHIYGGKKPWHKVFGVGSQHKIRWWKVALQVPFFSEDLIKDFAKLDEMAAAKEWHDLSAVYAEFKDEFASRKIFDKYLGSVILSLSGSLKGYLKMPFVVKKIFKNKGRAKLGVKEMEAFLREFEAKFSGKFAKIHNFEAKFGEKFATPSLRGDLSPKQSTSLNSAKNFTKDDKVVDCFEFADANSRNDSTEANLAKNLDYRKSPREPHAQQLAEQNDGVSVNLADENIQNLIAKLAKSATRAYHRRKKLKLIFLPLKIRKIKREFGI